MFHGYSASGSKIIKVVRGGYTSPKMCEVLNCASSVLMVYIMYQNGEKIIEFYSSLTVSQLVVAN